MHLFSEEGVHLLIFFFFNKIVTYSLTVLSDNGQNEEGTKARLADKQSWLPSDPFHAQGRHQKSIWSSLLLNTTLWKPPQIHQCWPQVWSWTICSEVFINLGMWNHYRCLIKVFDACKFYSFLNFSPRERQMFKF